MLRNLSSLSIAKRTPTVQSKSVRPMRNLKMTGTAAPLRFYSGNPLAEDNLRAKENVDAQSHDRELLRKLREKQSAEATTKARKDAEDRAKELDAEIKRHEKELEAKKDSHKKFTDELKKK
eukprot:TRINITY_DN514_c0_g1_i1.p1 TRINITY_DN514_c0_g1~~TRINITY_DN514_c0_g1_i1.p1  ORF type:complete len:121 (+),score=61.27 TRINITY_DN514_c0_g1_i1:79-441(+)